MQVKKRHQCVYDNTFTEIA